MARDRDRVKDRGPCDPAPVQALIFDLDGTLVDTVYAHVFAWQRALIDLGSPVVGPAC